MNRMMTTAVNSLNQLQKHVDIISHNVANANTNGFKRRDVSFAELMAQQINNHPDPATEIGRQTPAGLRQGVGARISQTAMITKQAVLQSTDRPLDIAFTKPNQWLKVGKEGEGANRIHFTRQGALNLMPTNNNEWMLVTQDGYSVLDENEQPIILTEKVEQLNISSTGTVVVKLGNGATSTFNLGVVTLHKPQFMEQKGDSLISLPDNVVDEIDPETIYTNLTEGQRSEIAMQQGVLEASNVEIGQELTDLILAQRSMQLQSRSITMADQMMGLVNGIR